MRPMKITAAPVSWTLMIRTATIAAEAMIGIPIRGRCSLRPSSSTVPKARRGRRRAPAGGRRAAGDEAREDDVSRQEGQAQGQKRQQEQGHHSGSRLDFTLLGVISIIGRQALFAHLLRFRRAICAMYQHSPVPDASFSSSFLRGGRSSLTTLHTRPMLMPK